MLNFYKKKIIIIKKEKIKKNCNLLFIRYGKSTRKLLLLNLNKILIYF